MRGPKDIAFVEARTREGKRVKPPGGKALLRLQLFGQQRGFDVGPEAALQGPRPRRRATRALRAESAIAQVYARAASALQAEAEAVAPEVGETQAPHAPAVPKAVSPSWRFLGPSVMHNGQTYGSSRVDVSGRVSSVAIDPGNRNHILVGSAGGGVWESRDRGVSWNPRTDGMPTLTVGAIAFDPRSPTTGYCGTGEGNFYAGLGAGLLRSTNGGTTWAVHAAAPFIGLGFYELLVDPAASNHLLAATTGGLYFSNDGGATWSRRRTAVTWDLAMHPAGGAAAELLAACQDGLFRSTNGGQTWSAVALPGAPASWTRLAVAIARSNPAIAYAFGAAGTLAYLYRRNASGTWQAVAKPSGLSITQAWYDWFLEVAADRDSQVYLGAIEVHRGDLVGTTWTWTTLTAKTSGDSIHPDQHALAFDPADPNTIYVGNDGGLYRSPNRGTNWVSLNNGLGITEIEYVAQDYGSSRWLVGGTQDNGSIRYRGSTVWDHAADGDGGDCGVNRGSPNLVFHTFYGMGMERSTAKGDFGSFAWIGPNVPSGYGSLFYPPMECNVNTVAQAGQSIFVSRNNGTSWTQIALPAGLTASAMSMPTPAQLLVGTTNGRLFRISWTGAAWSAATELTRPRAAWMSDIFVDPNNLNRIWVTYTSIGGGRVFRSDNGGSTWTDRSAGLPNLPMNAVEVDPANPNRVWVAADLGVYQSRDAGATWANFSLGLPNVLVADLLFHPHARVLRTGTRNRGVWEIPVDGWLANPICGMQWTGTIAANAEQSWFTFNWPATWHVVWTVMPTTVRPGAPELTWDVHVERANPEYVTHWIKVKNLTPVPVTFEGRYAILSKY